MDKRLHPGLRHMDSSALQAHGMGGTQPRVAASRDYSHWPLAGLHGQQLASGIATEEKTLGASLPCWNAAMVRSGPGDIKTWV